MEDRKLDNLNERLSSIEKKKQQLDTKALRNYVKFADDS